MLTSRIRMQLIAFVVIALGATSYLGAKYVGIDPFSNEYKVAVALPNAGGSFENGEVTFRGVPVGRIDELKATPDGAIAVLRIEGDAPSIPSDVDATVVNRSAIGEQYIDLRGGSPNASPLDEGDQVQAASDSQPPPVDELLRSGRDFAGSVDGEDLTTVIDEVYDATQGTSDEFGYLLSMSQDFYELADTNFLVTSALIENSDRVLATQLESGNSIKSFSADLNTIASTLESSDKELSALINNSPAAAREVDALFRQVGRPLGTLMGNLITPAQVFGVNSAGVEDALIRAPEAVSIGWSVNSSRGLNLGLVQNYFNPLPCTSGYGGTELREGLDTEAGKPFNLKAGCTVNPSSGTNVRGPNSVPSKLASSAAADVSSADSLADLMGGNE